ncbi:MAG: DUF4419 domain-containing protein, partial [Myxococcales bacterium]|nr:DUF4419 domain-containing protein [Myxococcales bacterium]
MPVTFAVDDVEFQGAPHTLVTLPAALRARAGGEIRCCRGPDRLVAEHGELNPLAGAIHCAFARHRPLVLSPDAVWTAIAQGFAIHVTVNAEALRHRFVRHEGKLTLDVEHDQLEIADDAWPGLVSAFCGRIREHVGAGLHRLLINDFTTTGPNERTASEIGMLHAFKEYFDYSVTCICGIPTVTLLGTPEDWRTIRARLDVLAEYELSWWTSQLAPVCDELVRSAEGKADRDFWRTIYKPKQAYGPEVATGWIRLFFPYLAVGDGSFRRSYAFDGGIDGVAPSEFPTGLCSAPMKVKERNGELREVVDVLGGFVGVSEDPQSKA